MYYSFESLFKIGLLYVRVLVVFQSIFWARGHAIFQGGCTKYSTLIYKIILTDCCFRPCWVFDLRPVSYLEHCVSAMPRGANFLSTVLSSQTFVLTTEEQIVKELEMMITS